MLLNPTGELPLAEKPVRPSTADPWSTANSSWANGQKGPHSNGRGAAVSAVQPTVHFCPEPDQLVDEMSLPADTYWLFDHSDLVDCFMEPPLFENQGRHPFQFNTMAKYQQKELLLLHCSLTALPTIIFKKARLNTVQ